MQHCRWLSEQPGHELIDIAIDLSNIKLSSRWASLSTGQGRRAPSSSHRHSAFLPLSNTGENKNTERGQNIRTNAYGKDATEPNN